MDTKALIARLGMDPHVEGGAFRELYREGVSTDVRQPSGVIYYALNPDEHADFHVIDCDEYWLYHAGASLEIWMIDPDGTLRVERFGVEDGEQPCILVKAGVVFGARPVPGSTEPTLLSCVTVPEFTYQHYELFRKAEALQRWPELAAFWAE